jgi:flagellar biosynthetic protein FliO
MIINNKNEMKNKCNLAALSETYFVMKKTIKAKYLLVVSLVLLGLTFINAQTKESQIGNFDIKKVQEAITDQRDTGTQSTVAVQKKRDENYSMVLIRILLYLGLVIAIIFVVAWIVKKSGIGRSSRIGSGTSMDIIEILTTGQNRNIMLVRVMDTVYLLGQTPTTIELIEKIEGQKAIELISSSKSGGTVMQFKDALNNFMGKMKKTS